MTSASLVAESRPRRQNIRILPGGVPDDFAAKVRALTATVQQALEDASAAHLKAVDLQVAAAVEARGAGRSMGDAVEDYSERRIVEHEQRTAASSIEAAVHEIKALLEEMQIHRELSVEQRDGIKAQLEMDIELCRQELELLKSPSSLQMLDQSLLRTLAELHSGSGALLTSSWDRGFSPMHQAAQDGRRDIIEYLLQKPGGRALLLARDESGRTPTQYASVSNRAALERWLLEETGSASGRSNSRGFRANRSVRPSFLNGDSIPKQYMELLERIESTGWGSVGWKNDYTMLHWAASKHHAGLCRYLLQLDADPDARDKQGRTALAIARQHPEHIDVVAALSQLR